MADLLDPELTPDDPRTGVMRINKLPLVLVTCLLALGTFGIIYAIYQRAQPPESGDPAAESGSQARRSSGDIPVDMADELFPDQVETFTEIPETPRANPEPEVVVTAEPPPPPFVLPPLVDPDTEAREAMRRQAMHSPTGIAVAVAPAPVGGGSIQDPLFTRDLDRLLAEAPVPGTGTPSADPNLRARKQDYLDQQETYVYSPHQRLAPLSPTELRVGTVINAVMVSALNSDLPGIMIAQVTRPVRDTQSGRHVMIPAGSKLIGDYDSHVAYGQRRVLAVWRRIQFPDGSTLSLPAMPAADAAGQSGLGDKVETHFWRTFSAATLVSVIGAGAQLSQPDDNGDDRNAQSELTAELGRSWSETSRTVIERQLEVQPTLRVRPGFRFLVYVNQDLILDPYEEGDGYAS